VSGNLIRADFDGSFGAKALQQKIALILPE